MVSLRGRVGVEHSNVSFSEGGGKLGAEEAAVRHAVLPQGSSRETPSGEGGHGTSQLDFT